MAVIMSYELGFTAGELSPNAKTKRWRTAQGQRPEHTGSTTAPAIGSLGDTSVEKVELWGSANKCL